MFMAFYRCREFSHKTSILEYERERETESGLFESVCVYKDLCLRLYVCMCVCIHVFDCVYTCLVFKCERECKRERERKIARQNRRSLTYLAVGEQQTDTLETDLQQTSFAGIHILHGKLTAQFGYICRRAPTLHSFLDAVVKFLALQIAINIS